MAARDASLPDLFPQLDLASNVDLATSDLTTLDLTTLDLTTLDITTLDLTPPQDLSGPRVDVLVLDSGTPAAGTDVVFSDSSGAIIAHLLTDANGHASAMVAAGSSVTALVPYAAAGPRLETAFGVEPGDSIVFGQRSSPLPTPSVGTANISVPGTVPNALGYEVSSGESVHESMYAYPVSLPIYQGSLSPTGTFDLVAEAIIGNDPIAFSVLTGLSAPSAMGTVSVTLPAWRTDFATYLLNILNGPPSATGFAWIGPQDRNDLFLLSNPHLTVDGTGAGTINYKYPADFATGLYFELSLYGPVVANSTTVVSAFARLPVATSGTVDFSQAPPQLLSLSATCPAGKTTPLMTWSAAGLPLSTGGIVLGVDWWTSGVLRTWGATVPSTDSSPVQFPELPDSLAAWRIMPGQAFSERVVIFVSSTDLYPNTKAFRTSWFPDSDRAPSPSIIYESEIF
jgi:hypothetical protein